VLFWFALELVDGVVFETAPGAGSSHWQQAIQLLEPFRDVDADEVVNLEVLANQPNYRGVRFRLV
jgi:hypothetical protein